MYHIINRGNCRADIFRSDGARLAFLKCLGEACVKNGWRVHAWCIRRNQYHLALETPRKNLAAGMQWLQTTFSMRFNRLRRKHGHVFQGRYKSLHVESGAGLGTLSHYIHLNPVRAKACRMEELGHWRWSSFFWLVNRKLRPEWYDPAGALRAGGQLADTAAGVRRYTAYLAWLAEDEAEQQKLRFDAMSKGWAIGTIGFKQTLLQEYRERLDRPARDGDLEEAREAEWSGCLTGLLKAVGRTEANLVEGKSADWKLAIAAELKRRSTVTNRWLAETMQMGNLHEVSRKVAAWQRKPDQRMQSLLVKTPRTDSVGFLPGRGKKTSRIRSP